MIYPQNFEARIEFDAIRRMLKEECLCPLGKERVDDMLFMTHFDTISRRLDEVVENLRKFEGRFVLQTMFLRSPEFDTASPEALERWMDIVRELKPREIMVYTIDRETPDKSLGKYTVEEMKGFVRPLIDEGYNIQIRG